MKKDFDYGDTYKFLVKGSYTVKNSDIELGNKETPLTLLDTKIKSSDTI